MHHTRIGPSISRSSACHLSCSATGKMDVNTDAEIQKLNRESFQNNTFVHKCSACCIESFQMRSFLERHNACSRINFCIIYRHSTSCGLATCHTELRTHDMKHVGSFVCNTLSESLMHVQQAAEERFQYENELTKKLPGTLTRSAYGYG